MAHCKSYRLKCYNGLRTSLRLFFQSFIVLLLLLLMIIWSLLLITVVQNRKSVLSIPENILITFPAYLNLSAQNNHSYTLSGSEASRQVFYITNLAIPLLFCFIGLIAVILSDIYWSAVSGMVLFVFWILEHQRSPLLFTWTTTTTTQILQVVGHALHLVTWSFLLLYGGLLTLMWRLKQLPQLPQPLPRFQPSPIYCQYGGNYCAYLSTDQPLSSFADAPPYYDTFPPPPTFETIQVRSTRASRLPTPTDFH